MDFLPSSSTSPAVTISLPNGIWDIPTLLRKSLKVSPTRDGVPKAEASRLSMSRAQSNIQEAIKELTMKTDVLEKDAANKVHSVLIRALNLMNSCLELHNKFQVRGAMAWKY
ncbi:hypothetical protein IEO21_04969 [Rhodonia placenta]|uniref:Uncharacterized protein n=1 Tax=Rhodonia placenta TaxID=104341 RepID=A0A8H7P2U9_9APHY|nr:hypothetical protein IEO21_04969 [Postia placenta]